MGSLVLQERPRWLNPTNLTDREKDVVMDSPIGDSSGLHWPLPNSAAKRKRRRPSSFVFHRSPRDLPLSYGIWSSLQGASFHRKKPRSAPNLRLPCPPSRCHTKAQFVSFPPPFLRVASTPGISWSLNGEGASGICLILDLRALNRYLRK